VRLFLPGRSRFDERGSGAGCEGGNAGEAGFQFAVFLFEAGNSRVRGGKVLFELSMAPAIFRGLRRKMTLRLVGILGLGSRKSGDDRGKIDLGERARRRQPLAALRCARAVEGADWRKEDAVENPVPRGLLSHIAFAALQPREIAENTLAFLPVGLALDSGADRIAVLTRG